MKSSTLVSFLGVPSDADVIKFSNFLLQLKSQRSRRKTVREFSITFILNGIIMFNSIQDGHFWGCSRMVAGRKSYNDETWHSYTLPKKDPENV